MSLTVHGKAVGGRFLPFNKDILSSWLTKHDGQVISVKLGEKRRSNQQNSFYWAAIIAPLSQHTGYSSDEMHEILKHKFLKKRDIVIADESVEIAPTTRKLTTEEFTQYAESIMQWAAEKLGVVLNDPR